jgi:signal transduction histidine kinase
MRLFQNTSLRRKQTLIILLTSSIVLLLACAAFVAYDVATFRRQLVRDVSVLADVIGNNCAAALDFNDPKAAGETLGSLRAKPDIITACIYDRHRELFAQYQRDGTNAVAALPNIKASGHEFTREEMHLFKPIIVGGETVGFIYLAHDLRQLEQRLTSYVGIAALVLAAALLVAFGLSLWLQRVVSDPILRLAQVARSVALEKNYSVRATRQSHDELGQLVDGFNEMLAQIQARDTALETARQDREKRAAERTAELEIIHKQLLEASRRGGMAEIAANVLHNVGNVLNSVNISTGLIAENVKQSRTASLARVVALLREHAPDLGTFITNDPHGKHVPAHLAQLSEQFLADQAALVGELDSLRRNIDHIKEIVAMQESYATFGGVKEMVNVAELVEDSLHMNERALSRHDVAVVREFETVPRVNVEKHKILQILVNLVRNAKYACDESGRADKRLTVRVANGAGRIRISVADNGVGIPPENLTRIFNHGFTTRKDGHGFGLHSAALAAKEMGGSLTVHSDGPGTGATFTLELPLPDAGGRA